MVVGEDFRDELEKFQREYGELPNNVHEGSPAFMKAYWEWWDSNELVRKKFADYPADMSHIFFFNTIWRKRND